MTGRQIKDQLLAPLAQGLGLAYRAHPKGIFATLPEHLLPKYSEGVGGQAWDHVTGTLDGVAFEFAELQKRKANSNFRGFMIRTAAWRDLPPFMFADERRITSFGIERAPDRYDNMERVGSKSSPQGRTIGLWVPQGQHGAEQLEPCLEAILSLEGYFGGDCRLYNAVNAAEGLFVTLETSADLFEIGGIFTAPHVLDAAMTKASADFDLVLGAARKLSSPA